MKTRIKGTIVVTPELCPQTDNISLVNRASQGDKQAQKEMIDLLWPTIHRLVHWLSPYPEENDDLTQEAMIAVLQSVHTFEGRGSIQAWAKKVAVRTALAHLRQMHKKRRLKKEQLDDQIPSPENIEKHTIEKRRNDYVWFLLEQLPLKYRSAIVLKFIYGYTVEESASLMKRRIATVKYLLRKGQTLLRHLSTRDPIAMDLFGFKGGQQ